MLDGVANSVVVRLILSISALIFLHSDPSSISTTGTPQICSVAVIEESEFPFEFGSLDSNLDSNAGSQRNKLSLEKRFDIPNRYPLALRTLYNGNRTVCMHSRNPVWLTFVSGIFSFYSTFYTENLIPNIICMLNTSSIFTFIIAGNLSALIISNHFPIDYFFMLNNMSLPNTNCASVNCRVEWYDARTAYAIELRISPQGSIESKTSLSNSFVFIIS